MKLSELRNLTLLEIAMRIRQRSSSPTEITQLLLDQIGRNDDIIKAYVTVCKTNSLKLAAAAEIQLNSGEDLGPLHGIPVSIKDTFETSGILTKCGSKMMEKNLPKSDCTVVKRLRSHGAVVLGKVNTHEFGLAGTTPRVVNPWNRKCISGGSSCGSGAAIAACSAIAATGSDTGGSIRIPASFCGVVGLKPTYGRVSRAGVFPESWSLDHVGPITRCVEDAALLLSIMAGHDDLDPTSSELPVPDYVGQLKNDISGVRVGVPKNHFFDRCDKEVITGVNVAIDLLKELGCRIVRFEFPCIPETMSAFNVIDKCEVSAYHQQIMKLRADDYQPEVRAFLEQGLLIPATNYINALRTRSLVFREVLKLFRRFDAIVTPTTPIVAPEIGENTLSLDGDDEDISNAVIRYVAPFNLTGLPALTVPCGFSNRGLPIGMQVISKAYDELTALQIGHLYERASDWHTRFPTDLT